MTVRQMGAILVAILASGSALAGDDKAKPRDGGSSSGRSVGERHHSSGSHSSSSSDVSRGSQGTSSSGSSAADSSSQAPLTDAQRRHPRAGTGTGHRFGRGYYYGWPYYHYSPYRYGSYDYYWYNGYSPYYYSGHYGYWPYSYHSRRYPYRTGSVRVIAQPSKTRVYVDGYYAGVADDFDGIFQRLNLPTGRHEIALRLEGYRAHRIRIYVPLDQTIKIRHEMVRGSGEDAPEDWAGVAEPGRGEPEWGEERRGTRDQEDDQEETSARDRGVLHLDVKPQDASIYVNGEFRGTGRMESLSLPAGRHHVEIVRPGYRVLERDVDVEEGRTTRLVAELDRR